MTSLIPKLKPFLIWLLFGVVCTGVLFATYWHFSALEQSNLSSEDLYARTEELRKTFTGKELADIKTMLEENINELESLSSDLSIKFSADSPSEEDNVNIPLVDPPTASKIKSEFKNYLDSLSFEQKIHGDTSSIRTDFREYELIAKTPDYDLYNYDDIQLKTESVHFKDGTSQNAIELEDGGVSQVRATKRIVSVDMSATFTVPGAVTKLKYTEKNRTSQEGIALESITEGEVTLIMPPSVHDKILYVQAIDSNGKALKQYGQSANTNNKYYLEKLKQFSVDTVERINQGELNNKDQLIKYLAHHLPSEADVEKEHPPQTVATYQFSGRPMSIIVFLKPEGLVQIHNFTINKTQDNYENGLTVSSQQQNGELGGIMDEQGQWVVQPAYRRLFQKVDNYYGAEDSQGADHVYLLDRQKKKLIIQPFHVMDTQLYQGRFIVVNQSPDNNLVKGLVDVNSHELVLPLKYYQISIDGKFITTMRVSKRKSRDIFNYEVYLQSNKQLIVQGEFDDLEVDDDLIIVNQATRSPKEISERVIQAGDGDGNNVYYNFYIYNMAGEQLNKEPYMNIDDSFGKDGLLRVTDIRDNSYYINRQAKKTSFDVGFYKQIEPFSNGLAAVKSIDDKYGYIDTKGDLVIGFLYDGALPFVGGSALVTKLGQGSFLITPKNKILKSFNFAYQNSDIPKDGQTARYTFVNYPEDGDNVVTSYNERGELIPEKN
ncbi:WG repeat-containing protein [Pseudomonas fluorescens]|uniref:WG repeat-containing protein n=1 Tax=Pseudomonas fluorescens TaxID=294 RepID=A0A5E7N2D4_PSEFL|nr:WG repeat-containing protein [Pseudomonas fluorescens]VVP31266.1 hypothetical protein PS880_04353 [Pseudomonas fluorescens]